MPGSFARETDSIESSRDDSRGDDSCYSSSGRVPPQRREILVRRAVNEALLTLAKLDAAGARDLAYPLPLVRSGIARMRRSLA